MPESAYRCCAIEGCDCAVWARGWCGRHYQRWRTKGDPLTVRPRFWASTDPCSVDGCDDLVKCKGYCERHYQHSRKYGTPFVRPTYDECQIDGCTNAPRSSTSPVCDLHYCRRWRTGSFDLTAYRVERPSYRAAHWRVSTSRGKAVTHQCDDCSEQAHHWSFAWRDVPSEDWLWEMFNGTALAYTGNPEDYQPRCRKCARRYDRDFARSGWESKVTRTDEVGQLLRT